MADSLRPTTSAKSKRPVHHDDSAHHEPMSAAARSRSEIRRNPSTDQKKARRSQVRKTAYDDGDGIRCDSCGRRAWSPITLRLRSGGEGHACTSNTDCVESLLDGGATLDPPTQTVRWSDGGESVIGVEDGSFFSRDASRKTAVGPPDGYRMKRNGQGEWQDTGSVTFQGALEAAKSLIDRAQSSTIVLIHNTFNDSVTVVDLDALGNVNSISSYEQFYGAPYPTERLAAVAAQTNQVANFTRADGLGLEEGDSVHVLGNPTTATFVGYDSVTDRVTLRYEGGQTVEVSPDVVIPDDAISAESRLSPGRTAAIHDHILGHLRGRI